MGERLWADSRDFVTRHLAGGLIMGNASEQPGAAARVRDDFEACVARPRHPLTRRRATGTTDTLVRLFVEDRRRLKIVPDAVGEKPARKLVFAAVTGAAERRRAVEVGAYVRRRASAPGEEFHGEYEAQSDDACLTNNLQVVP